MMSTTEQSIARIFGLGLGGVFALILTLQALASA